MYMYMCHSLSLSQIEKLKSRIDKLTRELTVTTSQRDLFIKDVYELKENMKSEVEMRRDAEQRVIQITADLQMQRDMDVSVWGKEREKERKRK